MEFTLKSLCRFLEDASLEEASHACSTAKGDVEDVAYSLSELDSVDMDCTDCVILSIIFPNPRGKHQKFADFNW